MDAQPKDLPTNPSTPTRTARARPRGRGYASGDARRTRILNIALQEFAENGYRGTSLARIAERAELTQAGLLHHFRSKQELLVAVLDLRDRMDTEHLDLGVLPLGGAAALDKLAELAEHNRNIPGLVQLFTVLTGEAVTTDHPAHGWAQDRYAMLRSGITASLEAGRASGELRADIDPPAVAAQVFAMMDGLQLQWLLDPEHVDMATLFRDYVEHLLRRIRA
ncbi:TetR/AcrR family transcriptional regulator [Embleya scabrispora]|uniref:TetR/AcrR family transcriptional regulator n=1 Tax=Embleya scabrispora TaxID=159449 RepID=UPI0003751E4F|nr:TetR/AcrR family transcriptional regulator [Embleya scabrispora]MYS82402.1 TetR family transcriptional regulator [Streptomyces sp. SID5474]